MPPQKGRTKKNLSTKYPRGDAKPSKDHLKPIFLQEFKKHGTIIATCNAIGINRKTVNNWRERDLEFDNAFIETDSQITETLERKAMQLALKEDCPHCHRGADTTMLIFLLKARDARFRTRQVHDININLIQDAVATLTTIIQAKLPAFCPSCHEVLDFKPDMVKEISRAAGAFGRQKVQE